MRLIILFFLLIPGLLLSAAPGAQAAKKAGAASKAADYKEIPAFSWGLVSTGFLEGFKNRNREIEAAEAGRFFPGVVAFALGRIDSAGHYLMLNCGAGCNAKRDALEERMVYASFLEAVPTPKAAKDTLFNARTWELSPLGYKYIEKLHKRYPDLPTRLGRLVGAAFAGK
ncbi:MAG TPA: hypothetical protein PKI19_13515 [Elusimicrobiales bacterium]|nr:hypothetical protein [Elusimicrobiales bacterium]